MKFYIIKKKIFLIFFLVAGVCFAGDLVFKLPYEKGESFYLTQAYNVFTHKGKDLYALDFSLGGCDIFDKPVLAAESGKIIKMEDWHNEEENSGYGNVVIVEHTGNIVSIYAHLNTVDVKLNDYVQRGEKIGNVGATGFCKGIVCYDHPGTHLHFAMYKKEKYKNAQGKEVEKLVPYKPEPMSGFVDFKVDKYYKSDNELYTGQELAATQKTETIIENEKKYTVTSATNLFEKIDIVDNGKSHSELTITESNGKIESIRTPLLEGFRIDQNGNVVFDKSFIANKNTSKEQKVEPSFEKKYNAQLVSKEFQIAEADEAGVLVVKPEQEVPMKAVYKNTGLVEWKKNVSLNITNSSMNIFYNNWLTRKRPVLVYQKIVRPDEMGDFSFLIKAPQSEGEYFFEVRPVIFLNNSFEWLGTDKASWRFKVEGELEETNSEQEPIANDPTISPDSNSSSNEGTGGVFEETEEESDADDPENKSSRVSWKSGGSGSPQDDSAEDMFPETYISNFPNELTNVADISFAFYSNFDGARFECKIDEDIFKECTSPIVYNNLGNGSHIFKVKTFWKGQEDPTPAEHSFVVDRRAMAKIENLQAHSLTSGKATLSGTIPETDIAKIKIFYAKEEEYNATSASWSAIEISFNDITFENNIFEINLENFNKGIKYYFEITTEDFAGNISERSNLASVIISDAADHLLISEFKLWGENNFIELYNPTLSDIELFGYSLQILNKENNSVFKINFENDDKIASNGFFLVAENEIANSLVPDLVFAKPSFGSASQIYLASTDSDLFNSENKVTETIADKVIDEIDSTAADLNISLERKAYQNSTSDSMLVLPYKYGGNGFDSNSADDFLVRQNPEMQNSASFKEPHESQKPTIETPVWNERKYFQGEEINLAINVLDLEDGAIPSGNIVWFMDNEFKTAGEEVVLTGLALGRHNIKIEATDSDGEKDSKEFFIEVISNGWKNAIQVPGADSLEFDAFLDSAGTSHIIFAGESSVYNEGDYGNSIYYQKETNGFLSESVEIVKLDDYGIGSISSLDLLVDENGIIHIVFTGNVKYEDQNYQVYYLNSQNNFQNGFNVYSGFLDAKIQKENDFIYIAATDVKDDIVFKQLSTSSDSVQIVKGDSYNLENSLGQLNYDFAVQDNQLSFNVSYYKDNSEVAPVQYGEGFPLSLAMSAHIYNIAVGRIDNLEGIWSFDLLEEKSSYYTSLFSDGKNIEYGLRQNTYWDEITLFARQDGVWYRKDLDLDIDTLAGFKKASDGGICIVSSAGINRQKIFWHFQDGDNFRKIELYDDENENTVIENLSYLMNNDGKEIIFFSVYSYESGLNEIYYLEN